jgi:hypothetical protein
MRHASPKAIAQLMDLITAVRARGGLKEPRPGVFYRKGRAWLHFHEDRDGLFADLRIGADWERHRVSEPAEQAALLASIDNSL